MCFNISVAKKKKMLEQRFEAEFEPHALFEPEFFLSAFTHPSVPVITNYEPSVIQTYTWGLIPHWVRNEDQAADISTKTFNARVETAGVKPSFRDSLKSQRCLVLVDGFYEWQTEGKIKTPYYIYKDGSEPFAFAGIWNSWVNTHTGEIHKTFSILTQDANPFMSQIHNVKKRQPIILTPETESLWLNEPCVDLIKQTGYETELQAHAIDKKFRTFGNSLDVIKPV